MFTLHKEIQLDCRGFGIGFPDRDPGKKTVSLRMPVLLIFHYNLKPDSDYNGKSSAEREG